MTYAEKLKDPRWQKMRLRVLEKDGFKCLMCNDHKTSLQVHHTEYIKGRDPWEYNIHSFETLCENCHHIISIIHKEHGYVKVFVKVGIEGEKLYYFYKICTGWPCIHFYRYVNKTVNYFLVLREDTFREMLSGFIVHKL